MTIGIITGCSTQMHFEEWLAENGLPYAVVDADSDISRVAAMIFTGGPDLGENHERDTREHAVFLRCREQHIPMLGICRGMQVVAHWMGAELVQDLGELNSVHRATEEDESRWHDIVLSDGRRWQVNSRHHQAVREEPFGCCLTAHAEDGTLELMLSVDRHMLLVQSHPERPEMRGKEIERFCINWLKKRL